MKFAEQLGLVMATMLMAGCGSGAGDSSSEPTGQAETASPNPAENAGSVSQIPPSGSPTPSANLQTGGAADAQSANASAPARPPVAFMQCSSCHSVEQGKNGIGPSLYGVLGRQAGSLPGFDYTTALSHSGITWNREALDTWLSGPMKMVPGTRMVIGVSNAEARQEIVDYLSTLK